MKKLFIITGLLIYSLTSFSQIIDLKNDLYWLNAGAGCFGSLDEISGVTRHLSVNLLNDSTIFKIKFSGNVEWEWGLYFSGPVPEEVYYSVDFMVGRGFSIEYFHLQYSFGLGVTWGVKRGKFIRRTQQFLFFGPYDVYEEDKFISPSIPLEMDLLLKPIKYAGLGVSIFGNLNFFRPYYGIALNLSIGKLK